MQGRFIRHNIVGSETHRPRPLAYLRGGWRGRRIRARRLGGWRLMLWAAAMLSGAAACGIVRGMPF